MPRIPEEEINAVREKADIVQVISRYRTVTRSGKDYKAICPFHNDHSPSLTISPDKQIYKCFVCGAGGNVFTFVQNIENISFPEAVEKVASIIGYPLSVHADAAEKPQDPHKEALYKILDETIRYTMYQMSTPSAEEAKAYLNKRGLSEEVRQKFQIGWNPGNDALYRFLSAKGYQDADMVDCNVIRTSPSGIHDVFGGRITFPIHDENGRPIGFSARTMDKANPSKYINTTDTVLFHKSDLVYNAHRARAQARRSGKIYVCEGVTDVIAFERAGIQNAVCTLGTSITDHQVSLLKRLSARIVFCYDGDEPGQAATIRACRMAMGQGCQVSVIRNDTGLDPDEIIRKEGPEALAQLVRNEISWMEFYLNYLKLHTNMDNFLEKKEMVQKAQKEISGLPDEFDRKYFTQKLSEITGFQLEYTPEKKTLPVYQETLQAVKTPNGMEEAENQLLAMMLASRQASRHFEEKLGYLTEKNHQACAMLIVDAWRKTDQNTLDVSSLIDQTAEQSQKDLLSGLAGSWAYRQPYDEKMMDGAIRKINLSIYEKKADAYQQQLVQPMNEESRMVILKEYQQCLLELRRLIDEENSERARN